MKKNALFIFCLIWVLIGLRVYASLFFDGFVYDPYDYSKVSGDLKKMVIRKFDVDGSAYYEGYRSYYYYHNNFLDSLLKIGPDNILFRRYIYSYNDKRLSTIDEYDGNNAIVSHKDNSYDFLGRLVEQTITSKYPGLNSKFIYKENEDGTARTKFEYYFDSAYYRGSRTFEIRDKNKRVLKLSIGNFSAFLHRIDFKYNTRGDMTEAHISSEQNVFDKTIRYSKDSVDKFGNWTMLSVHEGHKVTQLVKREIYY